jgi:Ca2+-binding RTX toxin-like protein
MTGFTQAGKGVRVAGALVLLTTSIGFMASASAVPTCLGHAATIQGTSGNDEGTKAIIGTSGPDVIVGLGGRDTIEGRGGGDRICGNGGDDALFGQKGDDNMSGDLGFDYMAGGLGSDVHYGRGGGDQIDMSSASGADLGADFGDAGAGADFISAVDQAGNDVLRGGDGDQDACSYDPQDLVSGCEF